MMTTIIPAAGGAERQDMAAQTMAEPQFALEISGLEACANRDERLLVNALSLSLAKGERLAIVGESGSGKTMTASAVMGLLPAGVHQTAGTVRIFGEDTAAWSAEQYRRTRNERVSIVMQNPFSAFDPVLTILSHFEETFISHGRPKREARQNALAALGEIGFSEPQTILNLYPFQMSGGMLQRALLALALIFRPPLIIADEATTDLDLKSQKNILSLLKNYCEETNAALLLITHDFGVAASLAQRMMLMKDGKVVETGDAKSFFDNPKSEYAKTLLAAHRALYSERFNELVGVVA
ncbi:MAG: ABC transporter ATP-binding protein [Spirochaetaceae bacterium]|jgi:ABC-type glutathione transport system ATPase component|nr:ABC transporter ATP-binding protein [Spirochaetaceae bacterium]